MIQHKYGNRFSMGELDGTVTERLQLISGLLHEGGSKAPQKSRLRDELWIKLWGNCSHNPVSALTGASLDLIGRMKPAEMSFGASYLSAKPLAWQLEQSFQSMSNGGSMGGGDHRTQAFEPPGCREGQADGARWLTSTVHELARRIDIAMPTLHAVAALVRMQGSVLGLYNFDDRIEKLIFQREDGHS